jgi:hypothetical protein
MKAKSVPHASRRSADRPGDSLEQRPTSDPRSLLARILDTPHLANVVPRLPPELLHRIVENCGLEDCGELVTLATPAQLAAVFDLDLWRPPQPGLDDQFDADRFGLWLEVLMESGATVAAHTLAGVDVDLAVAGFAKHVRIFDAAALSPAVTTDDELIPAAAPNNAPGGFSCEIGGYLVVAQRTDSWDAIVGVLTSLDAEHQAYFHRVMRGCRRLSNSEPEIDGLDDLLPDDEQAMFDLALNRERRRELQGFATAAQARAFLQMSRQLRLGHGAAPPDNPVARAYFQAIDWTTSTTAPGADSGSPGLPSASGERSTPEESAAALTAIIDVLTDAGVLPQPPRALLEGDRGDAPRLMRIQAQMQFARDRDHLAFSMRTEELAYLANALVAGCAIQGRPFTVREASDAAAAVCNLGLESWPARWLPAKAGIPEDFLVNHDLISVFQVGWTVLHSDVGMYAAKQLIHALTGLRNADREIQTGLNALRIEMKKHCRDGAPWRARGALDVLVLLDMPAWATLLGLLDECPVLPAAIGASRGSRPRTVSASTFEFISERGQIAAVHEFMESLADTLRY